MNGEKRREAIIAMLLQQTKPISGSELAQIFCVSRQVIVQDIALLKASEHTIISTNRGYLLQQVRGAKRVFQVTHDHGAIADELYTIVDAGGKILDVSVVHDLYGELRAKLLIRSRRDVDEFVQQLAEGKISPLMHLTNGAHCHTVEADSEEILNHIEENLRSKNYLT